ncbi:MAG: AEC family transporter [Solirubrobacteraceae bacterium]|nr:AEC family transporter [Solirubrobacteraceae bacterium]
MLAVALVIVASIAVGAGAERRWGEPARRAGRRALDLLIYGLLPVITFFTVSHVELTAGVGAGLAFGWAERLVPLVLAWAIGEHVLRLPRPATGAIMLCVVLANTGFLGVPIVATMLGGDQAIGQALTYDIAVSGPALLLVGFAIGAAYGTRAGDTPRERLSAFLTRNPALFAFVLALVAPEALTPDWAREAMQVTVLAIAPLGFFALGVNLMQEQEEGARIFPPPLDAPVAVVLGLRLLVAPAVMLALSTLVVRVPDAFLVQAAMSSGVNGLAVAHVFGLDLRIYSAALAWSTAIVLGGATLVSIGGLA